MNAENGPPDIESDAEDFTIPEKIRFNYLKSNHHRVIKSSGAIGRASATGEIAVHIYSDRSPIPKWVDHPINTETGVLGTPTDSESLHDMVREVEATLVMSVSQAESLGKWLQEKAAESRKITDSINKRKGNS